MRKFFNHFSLSIMMTFSVSLLQANENPFLTTLPFKEGIIHYTISGSEKGFQTTYIRNYGKERITYRRYTSYVMHAKHQHETLTLQTLNDRYTFDLTTQELSHDAPLVSRLSKQFTQLTKQEQEEMLQAPTTELLNFSCLTFTDKKGAQVLLSKEGHLLLQSTTHILGFHTRTTATKIEIKPVSSLIFSLPTQLSL